MAVPINSTRPTPIKIPSDFEIRAPPRSTALIMDDIATECITSVDYRNRGPLTVGDMPEGDTIRRLADKIGQRFTGERCVRCVTRDPRLVGVDLAGATVVDVDAVGKHLLIRFDNGATLHSHLMMTGSWVVGPPAVEPEWRRRIEMWMETGRLTGIDLPVVELVETTRRRTSGRSSRP